MGDHKVNLARDNKERGKFIKHLIKDIDALEYLFENDLIEREPIRIGAEQEFCLVNEHWRPAKNAVEILEAIKDDHFTTELAAFNLEINLDPFELKDRSFTKMADQLKGFLSHAEKIAAEYGSKIVLTGILPSISEDEISLDYMTPNPRYYALNDKMKELRGGDFRMLLSGVDELSIFHDSVMYEACNTSFQMHLQIDPKDMVSSYNWSQAIAGPVLALCVNSPLLLGRELWSESRIALFQQSIDTRKVSNALSDKEARVSFGNEWATGNLVDLFKKEVIRHSIILTKEIEEDSLETVKQGKIPKLAAMNLHNGTVYRWNRPCYGSAGGKAHVRIENRYIPSGPSVDDEMANFVFWVGLMKGRPKEFDDMPSAMDFRDAKANFLRAAKEGADCMVKWKGKSMPVRELLAGEFMEIAKAGLKNTKVDQAEVDYYLGIIEKRIKGQTAAEWMVEHYRKLQEVMQKSDALIALTQTIHIHQRDGIILEKWPKKLQAEAFPTSAQKLRHIMSTSLVCLSPKDNAELSLRLMKWRDIHHLPIVNDDNHLVGLLTMRHLRQYWDKLENTNENILVEDIMIKNVLSAEGSMQIDEASDLMIRNDIGCLPIVKGKELIGIVTNKDLKKHDQDKGGTA
jgi:CBS domain-containing protein